jgi:hypothetical protein
VHVAGAPDEYEELLDGWPAGVERTDAPWDLVHLFTTSSAELAAALTSYRTAIARDGMVWVSWPKKASKVPTDVTEDVIREVALPMGFVDVKVCAVDQVWSGLKLVIRRELR